MDWSRVPHDPDVFGLPGQAIYDVSTGGPGLVAVGKTVDRSVVLTAGDEGDDRAAVWISEDGIVWSRVLFTDRSTIQMEGVTAGGPGLVAVGVVYDPEAPEQSLRAAVWTSEDGIAWSRAPDNGVFSAWNPPAFSTWMRSVTVGGPGLVAVGDDAWTAAVWTSLDGITWSRVTHDPALFGNGESWETHSTMHEIVATDSGLVAIGELDGHGAAWTSPDGLNWSVTVHDFDFNGVTAGGPGYVAVGGIETTGTGCHARSYGDCHAVVWTSTDAVTWTQVPDDAAVFGDAEDKQMMSDVISVGDDLVAVGTSVWVSPDGINWTRIFHDPDILDAEQTGLQAVTLGGPGLAAIGELNEIPTVWTATLGK